jgi:hypothetical protein
MMQPAALLRLVLLLSVAVVIGLLVGGATAQAENMPVLNLPLNVPPIPGRPPAPRPWSIEVDPSGIEGQVYRGVKVTVTSNSGPVTANRSLRVVLSANGYSEGGRCDERVTAFIDVPEGQSSATVWVDVPQRRQWHWMFVEFYEDGEPLKNCAAGMSIANTSFRSGFNDSAGLLVISQHAPTRNEHRALMTNIASTQSPLKDRHLLPDVRWLLTALPNNQMMSNGLTLSYTPERFDDAQILQTLDKHTGLDLIPPEELSARWLSSSNADLAVISLTDMRYLQEKYPDRLEALLRWTMAGGSLMVYGCGDEWQRLSELYQLVGLPEEAAKPEESARWRMPHGSDFHGQVQGVNPNSGTTYYGPGGMAATPSVVLTEPPSVVLNPPDPLPFASRRLGLGVLVAYRAENPFPGTPRDWGGLWNTIGSYRFLASRRYGVSFESRNPDFWNFVIPGVGEAPVYGFMAMIALFMLLIGPVNYQLLKRWRRLSLLLVTVPLGAGLFTLGLFSFAILSDGFSTRTRVRSFTALEPTAGRAASMSRQTYYTAFVPSDGMHYPPDTAVFPLYDQPYDMARAGNFFDSDSQWLDGKLNLQRRYLAAREHRQLLAVRSTDTQARLDVKPAGERLQVHNLLGTRIELALLSDAHGQLYVVKNLDASTARPAEPIELSAARKLWTEQVGPKTPALPPGFDSNRYTNIFSRRYYYGGSQWNASQASSLLERGIHEVDELLLSNSQSPTAQQVQGQAFVAITTDSILGSDGEPLAPLGIQNTQVVESLHVVRGSW